MGEDARSRALKRFVWITWDYSSTQCLYRCEGREHDSACDGRMQPPA